MKQNLLLTSAGIPVEFKQYFLALIKDLDLKKIKVSHIVTAAYGENGIKPKWINYYNKQFEKYGIKNIDEFDLKNKTQKDLEKYFKNIDIIFVGGGNTFYLLNWIKKSGFNKIINKLLNLGKIYIGVSAGSYVACPTIEQATWEHQDKNRWNLKDLTALNLVPFLISAHYTKNYKNIILKEARKTRFPIVALNDKQAILIKDDKYKIIGDKDKVFFNEFCETM